MFGAHGLVDETQLVGAVFGIRKGTWRVTQEGATVPTSKLSSNSFGALGLRLIFIRVLEYVVGIVRQKTIYTKVR